MSIRDHITIHRQPQPDQWSTLLMRPTAEQQDLINTVDAVMQQVRKRGDQALLSLTRKYDGIDIDKVQVHIKSIPPVSENFKESIERAFSNIRKFHKSQELMSNRIFTMPGVSCWRESRPIETVGLYVPGGSAPLFSTVLMLGIPAQIAGCHRIILCTPPGKGGSIAPEIQFAAKLCGLKELFCVGGAQAIAAMSFGTESIPKVDKIFGPGNQYVTEAKMQAQKYGVAIDMPAGPSEVLVIADESAVPSYLAADLLSQAEHGPDSQVVFLTTSERILEETILQLDRQLLNLPRARTAQQALKHSRFVYFSELSQCLSFSNQYAPEHLILCVRDPHKSTDSILSAGSVFLGNFSPEAVGDYASGTNHTLPTNGWARSYSGVSLDSFVKKITFQSLSADGLKNIGPTVETLAQAESLEAHRKAVSIRLKDLGYGNG